MFLLVQIYYSGALTMFFTSETPLPFETTKEVIRSHPDWKMVYQVKVLAKDLVGSSDKKQ